MEHLLGSFFEGADHVAELIDDPETATRWDDPSALEGLSVGGLVAHLVQGARYMDRLLDIPEAPDAPAVDLGEYVTSFKLEDFDTGIHRYIRDKAEHGATFGPEAASARFRTVLAALRKRLPAQPRRRMLDMRPTLPWAISLEDRLRLHVTDLVVHIDDLAVSLGRVGGEAPEAATGVAIEAMVAAARSEHGDIAVIRALARRERSEADVFPVF